MERLEESKTGGLCAAGAAWVQNDTRLRQDMHRNRKRWTNLRFDPMEELPSGHADLLSNGSGNG
jgi:hypothetical protein